jgi:hypothetical protein
LIKEDPFEDGRRAYHIYSPALAEYGAATWGFTREEASSKRIATETTEHTEGK